MSNPDKHIRYLFPIRENKKRRYIDQQGNAAFSKAFENGGDYSEGLAPVCVRGSWGYMNEEGEIIIEPRFSHCDSFSEGMGRVTTGEWPVLPEGDSRVGYVDCGGNLLIEPQFFGAEDFHGGIAAVQLQNDELVSYINKRGQVVIPHAVSTPDQCHDDRIPFECDNKYGFCDSVGRVVIEPKYGNAYGFREGLAAVSMEDSDTGYGFIDPIGNLVIPHEYRGAMIYFSEGLAAIWTQEGFGFIDKAGRSAVRPQFYCANAFYCGRSATWPNKDGLHGFIDLHGEIVIPSKFETVENFRNGLALVKLNGKQGYINRSGQFVWGPVEEEQW